MKLTDERLMKARELFEGACACSRQHSTEAGEALERYGDHGPDISGCVRDHFPAGVKDRLRELAREVTRRSDAAWAARPKYVRTATIRRLASDVARRQGSGYYGPRA